jgi:hypothetical protein
MTHHQVAPTLLSACTECGGAIKPGERITRRNAFEAWRHATCPKTKFDFEPADVCGGCFTVRATTGACAC